MNILKLPFIARRIKDFINNETYMEEFNHTILHKQNIFQKTQSKLQKQQEKVTSSSNQDYEMHYQSQ